MDNPWENLAIMHPTLPIHTWRPGCPRWQPCSDDAFVQPRDDAECGSIRDWLKGLDDGELLGVRGRDIANSSHTFGGWLAFQRKARN
jgi:hypothetical protein